MLYWIGTINTGGWSIEVSMMPRNILIAPGLSYFYDQKMDILVQLDFELKRFIIRNFLYTYKYIDYLYVYIITTLKITWLKLKSMASFSIKNQKSSSSWLLPPSEIRGLCLMKWPSEMHQNLSYFWNMKIHVGFFIFLI